MAKVTGIDVVRPGLMNEIILKIGLFARVPAHIVIRQVLPASSCLLA